ncbi:NAD(P)/FAD-dependent oxidoreductase [Caldovatus aquaticus]|uniref:FAD-dependent oxidoreductase n=1 Tax=Caldovatus aquaticus TaxID=2865671 RepID=A0ABS7EX14_9PROT|nr:FAD-dependent oxidoreductase [Caldovatus aquaticus]
MSGADVLILGAGQAGVQLAAALREGGHDGRILLLGEEPELPYQRPPLSKAYLSGKADAPQLRLRTDAFYAENRIGLRLGARAVRIERAARRVRLASGEALAYGHLVLATGARNRALPVPGAALDGVMQLRTLAEAEALRRRLGTARRAVVVGAGFIGLEFAAVAAARGLEVTVVEALDRPMARSVSPLVAAHLRAAHERAGVRFAFGAAVTRIAGEAGRVAAVETADGRRFPADLVLIGIGVVPNAGLAAEAGLAVADGIVVDALLRTGDPAISAIGDCARFPCRFAAGAPVRLESVQNAADQARCLAARLLGRAAPYAALPWFWSDQGALRLQIAGLSVPHDRAVLRGDPAGGQGFSVFCFRGGRLAGVESVNRPLEHVLARRILERGLDLTPEQAADPAFDLKAHAGAQAEGARGRAPGA